MSRALNHSTKAPMASPISPAETMRRRLRRITRMRFAALNVAAGAG